MVACPIRIEHVATFSLPCTSHRPTTPMNHFQASLTTICATISRQSTLKLFVLPFCALKEENKSEMPTEVLPENFVCTSVVALFLFIDSQSRIADREVSASRRIFRRCFAFKSRKLSSRARLHRKIILKLIFEPPLPHFRLTWQQN